ncbi:MAG: PIG-L family deacetylase [Deltaproteobacteria bacterium]|nr:PIG-L family deacetylase [Deltaproteobacteria bacterium]
MLQEENFIPYTPSDLPPGPYLVFAPHPDDETFGMGGTIALAGQAGIAVHVVVLTDGQQAGDLEKRRQEAKDVSQVLGLAGIDFWGLPDRELHRITDMESRVLKILKSVKPRVVFLPSLQEFHPDHRAATFKIWSTLQKLHYSGQLWTYEITRQAEANRLIDITKVIPIKQQAVMCYRSQLALNNYEAVVTGINQARTLTLQEGITHAEAFFEFDGWRDSCPCTASLTTVKPYWQSDSTVEDSPLVSVIIRTNDRPRLLREALTSIAEQTYPNIEAVVVNDGGQDVESVVRDFKGVLAKIQYVQHGANRGRPAAANTGIRKAEGEWICFLDDDDLYEPDALRILISSGTKAGANAVYGQVIREHYRPDGSRDPEMPDYLYARSFDRDLLYWQNYIPINALIFKKQTLTEIRAFDNNLTVTEDWDFILRLAENHDLLYVPVLVAHYRCFGASTVTGGRFTGEEMRQDEDTIHRKWWHKIDPCSIHIFRQYIAEETDRKWKAHIRKTEALISDQMTELESSRKEIENLRGLIKEVTMEREHWLRQTELFRSSFSWRITEPLRLIRRFQLQLKEIIKSRVQS